ncbi:MAG: endonuclease Q family protein [Dehalococcoidia bacterium]
MAYTADLHLHSRYARGTSPALSVGTLAHWARLKGIDVLSTGDFTHPAWLRELKASLTPREDGLLALHQESVLDENEYPLFVLGTEVSCVYAQGGRTRRVHLLCLAPGFDVVGRICDVLGRYGSLAADGRPTLGLSARDVAEAVLDCDPGCEIIPAHAWTPWFSVFGSKGGFDSLPECFGDMLPHIHAIETGLSSDPLMNWGVPQLENLTLVSFSDAHSAPRLGRELTVFEGTPSYEGLRTALRDQAVSHTVEFFPEEGKYHYDGHRRCGVCQKPEVSRRTVGRCPECGRGLTLGVLHRIEALSAGTASVHRGVDGLYRDPDGMRPPFRRLVPLEEIIAEVLGKGRAAKGVQAVYQQVLGVCGTELAALENADFGTLADSGGELLAEAVLRMRRGTVEIEPGYDGVYGKVRTAADPAPIAVQ